MGITWSFIGGAKFLFTSGLGAKLGMSALLKAAGFAALSTGGITIPLAAAAFGLTYLYNYAEN